MADYEVSDRARRGGNVVGGRWLILEAGQRRRYGDSYYTYALLADPATLTESDVKTRAREDIPNDMLPAEKPDRKWFQPKLLSVRVESVNQNAWGDACFADKQPRRCWVLRFEHMYTD